MQKTERLVIITSAGEPPSEFILQAMEEVERKIQSGEAEIMPAIPTWELYPEIPHAED